MSAILSHRLAALFGTWTHDRTGRVVGVKFICPTCPQVEGAVTLAVMFENPPDGGPAERPGSDLVGENGGRRWHRTGDTLDTLTLTPSVDCSKCGHWHGIVSNGEAP